MVKDSQEQGNCKSLSELFSHSVVVRKPVEVSFSAHD